MTVGEFIGIMQGAQKQYWQWEELRNSNLFNLGSVLKESKEFKDSALLVIGMDRIFRNTVNTPTRNGNPSTILKINPELDVFLGEQQVVWPRAFIDIRRRLPLYSLQTYQANQSGGSMQGISEEDALMAEELEETVDEARENLENSSVSEKEFEAFKDMMPSSGGKRHSRRRNKRNRSKKAKKAKKSRRHRR